MSWAEGARLPALSGFLCHALLLDALLAHQPKQGLGVRVLVMLLEVLVLYLLRQLRVRGRLRGLRHATARDLALAGRHLRGDLFASLFLVLDGRRAELSQDRLR